MSEHLQKLFCQICGKEFETSFGASYTGRAWHHRCCSTLCWKEYEWRQTLAIMNRPYHPDPNQERWKKEYEEELAWKKKADEHRQKEAERRRAGGDLEDDF